jgi:hypothetical protein
MSVARVLMLSSSCLAAGVASAAGGSATDLAVSYTLPADHWTWAAPADLTGAGATPAEDPITAAGWWYRVTGTDTFEHHLPPPTSETYSGWNANLTHVGVGPRGFQASEFITVYDNDRPSGTLRDTLCIFNTDSAPLEIALFHYLDADADGTPAGDSAALIQPGYLLQTDGPGDELHYRAPNPAGWAVRPATGPGSLLSLLNDGSVTQLDNSGAPAGPANLAAAYQFELTVPPSETRCVVVRFSARVLERVVKGDVSLDAMPDVFLQKAGTGEIRAWEMRRTQRWQLSIYPEIPPNWDFVGQDDFSGNLANAFLHRDRVSGEVYLNSLPLLGVPILPLNWQVAATRDFNADGRADILWRNTTSQKLVVWLMNGRNRIGHRIPSPDQAVDANWEVVGAADFSADGVPDLLWYNQTSGKVVVWMMDALVHRIGGGFTNPASVGNNNWKAVAVADFGRGAGGERSTEDILWRNDSSGKLVVWHMDSFRNRTSGVFTTPDAPDADPLAWRVVGPR